MGDKIKNTHKTDVFHMSNIHFLQYAHFFNGCKERS